MMKSGVVLNKITRLGAEMTKFVLFLFIWMTRFGQNIMALGFVDQLIKLRWPYHYNSHVIHLYNFTNV
jgi:hypothetical protein